MKKNVNIGYLVFLSFVAALGGFLFGYDTAVISGTIAQVTVLFHLDTLQQGWYVGCALIGSIVGVLFAGVLSDKFGRKLTMVLSAVLFSSTTAKNGFKLILWQRKSSGHGIFHTCFRCCDCSDLLLKRRKQAELCKGRFRCFSPEKIICVCYRL